MLLKKIDSLNNNYIKELLKLKLKKYRDAEKKFLVEGYHLVEEAKDNLVEVLIVDEKDIVEGVSNILVTKEIIKKLSFSETPQMIIGVCKYLSYNENENFNKVLLLDGLQDPGNIGTLIRSALGFGIDLVVLSNDSVDLYNDKLIRSSQGALFKVKTVQKDIKEMISLLKKHNIKVFGTSLKNGKYRVQCHMINIETGESKKEHLGYYDTQEKAFEVYKQFKENYIKQVADYYKEHIPQKLYHAMYSYEVEIND